MARTVTHRGPEGIGYYVSPNAALAFTRLSIVDLETGMQPLFNEDGTLVLVCNGEIYNYRELRRQLRLRGHRFNTESDAEVLIHLYEDVGARLLDQIDGQFAFAIYDARSHALVAARDQFGIAPFYYSVQDDLLLFGSEIKAILQHPSIRPEVDLIGLDQTFTFPGLISPRTMFKGVKSLPNGHYLVWDRAQGIRIREYWDLIYPKLGEVEYGEKDWTYVDVLREALQESVRYRLQADVPVGVYLSGGLDSSLVAAEVNRLEPSPSRHSFGVDVQEQGLSEGRYQRQMAARAGFLHHSYPFRERDITELLPQVIYHCECPLKETYNTAALALSRCVREQEMKVVLAGQGADELFAGYVGYRFDRFRQLRSGKRKGDTSPENALRAHLWGDDDFFYEHDYHNFHRRLMALYSPEVCAELGELGCLAESPINRDRIAGVHPVHRRSYVDYKLRLCDHLLTDHGDRMVFANGVECRYPFLDRHLVSVAQSIPPDLKLRDFEEKYILKQIAHTLVPQEIIDREKFGFVAPGSHRLLADRQSYVHDLLSPERLRREGYFQVEAITELKRQYKAPGFQINVPFDDDLLIVAITFGLLLETFDLPHLA